MKLNVSFTDVLLDEVKCKFYWCTVRWS
jgi:hypothetical protein